MRSRSQTRLCREGWYLLFVLTFVILGAMIRDINLLFIVGGMMLGPLLYDAHAAVVSLRGLQVRRTLPESICAGDLLVVGVAIQNTRARFTSRAIVVDDRIRSEAGSGRGSQATASVLFPRVAPDETSHLNYHGHVPQRGVYRFGPLRVSTRFPLGLVRSTAAISDRATLTVFPRLGTLTPAWRKLHQMAHVGSRQYQPRQGMTEADFYSLRDWQTGDSQRWIHWRTSARRGSLVVRQFEQKQQQDLLLLVDLWRPVRPNEDDLRRVEMAVGFAATVAADMCRSGGSRLDLGIAGRDLSLLGGTASAGFLDDALRRLAIVESGASEQLADLIAGGCARAAPSTAAVLVTTREVDLSEPRLASAISSGNGAVATRRMVVAQCDTDSLRQYFHWSPPEVAAR
ncbi:MAG: DUF58 domain-containing protein [Pirellulales bacterium]